MKRRRGRERRGLALAEGVRLVEEVLAVGVPIRGVVISPTLESTRRGEALERALVAAGTKIERTDDQALATLSDTDHPQGIVAVIEPRTWTLDDVVAGPRAVLLVLDAVQDPGNAGTMLRTAFALGAAGVVALPGTADLTNPKVLRGSMGAFFRLPCIATDAEALGAWATAHGAETWITDAAAGPMPRRPRGAPVLLVLGNEGAGVTEALDRPRDAQGRHRPCTRSRVAQCGGRCRDSPVRGIAWRLKDLGSDSSWSWPLYSACFLAVSSTSAS